MDGNKILGIIIVIALILSVAAVGYSAVNNAMNPDKENVVQTQLLLDESELNYTEFSAPNSTISTVNLHIDQKVGGVDIKFADNASNVYNITSNDEENSTTNVTYTQDGDHLDVNIVSDKSDQTIILSNKYAYNISANMVTGGLTADITDNAQIDELNVNSTLGGINLAFNGGSLNTSNIRITSGGLNIVGEPKGVTTINSEIEIGGINIQTENPIADIFSNIDVGGISPGDYQQVSDTEYKGNSFDSSENKLIINNNIKVGGVNTRSFS